MEVLRAVRRCGERGDKTTVAGIKPTATETCGCGSLVGGEEVRGEEMNWRRWRGRCRVAAWGWRRVL